MALQGIALAILLGIAIGGVVYQIVTNRTSGIHRPMAYGQQRAIQGSKRPSARNKRKRYYEKETTCRICLSALNPQTVVLSCGHKCHIECTSIKCSLCNRKKPQQYNNNCCECSEDLTPVVRVLKCGHKFHKDCIRKWNNICPLRCTQDFVYTS